MNDRFLFNKLIPAFLFYIFTPNISEACSSCVMAQFDKFLPPIYLWVLFATVWFLSLSIFDRYNSSKLPGIPSLLQALLIVLILLVVGAIYIGPLGFMLLLIPCFSSVLNAFLWGNKLEKKLRYHLKIISCVWLICLIGLFANSIRINYTRTDSDFILQWESTYPARRLLQNLVQKGPDSLEDLRRILKKGMMRSSSIASNGIALYGDPDYDVPLILAEFQLRQNNEYFTSYAEKIENNLSKMTGIKLPKGSSPETWKAYWKKLKAIKR